MFHSLTEATCQWPGCSSPALCRSGNWGDRLVCRAHFEQTNGGGPVGIFFKVRPCRARTNWWVAWCSTAPLSPGAGPVTDPAEPLWFEMGCSRDESMEKLKQGVEAEVGPAKWEEMQL